MAPSFRLLLRGSLALLMPATCRLCASPLTEARSYAVCEDCMHALQGASLTATCDVCGEPLPPDAMYAASFSSDTESLCTGCSAERPRFIRATAFGSYDDLRSAIHLMKFEGMPSLACAAWQVAGGCHTRAPVRRRRRTRSCAGTSLPWQARVQPEHAAGGVGPSPVRKADPPGTWNFVPDCCVASGATESQFLLVARAETHQPARSVHRDQRCRRYCTCCWWTMSTPPARLPLNARVCCSQPVRPACGWLRWRARRSIPLCTGSPAHMPARDGPPSPASTLTAQVSNDGKQDSNRTSRTRHVLRGSSNRCIRPKFANRSRSQNATHSHRPSGDVRTRARNATPLQTPVLVLNASYEPINICGARRALVLVLKGIARTEEEQGFTLHAARARMPMPSVIRLLEYRRIPHQTRALSRKNILLRDRNTCQYCGCVLTAGDLTLDHVLPRSRGRPVDLGEPGGLLPRLQSTQGQPVAA